MDDQGYSMVETVPLTPEQIEFLEL
ncbi:hypothetical protein V12B01_02870 [Vibrio splendidus 12B01]|nr:hypothetical protein V12B01_02870 [Vibrio splendidus 12B01]